MRAEFAQGLRRDWIALILAVADNRVLGRTRPDEKGLAGRPLRVVEVWSGDLAPVRVAIDAETHLLTWISYETAGPAGRVTVKESFDDYRDVKGIRIPFTAVVRRDDSLMLERTLTDVQINVTFPPGVLPEASVGACDALGDDFVRRAVGRPVCGRPGRRSCAA